MWRVRERVAVDLAANQLMRDCVIATQNSKSEIADDVI